MINHIKEISALSQNLRTLIDYNTVQEYLTASDMAQLGTMGTNVEIHAAAHWLKNPIYTFIVEFHNWMAFYPPFVIHNSTYPLILPSI